MGQVTARLYEREVAVAAARRLLDAASAGRGGTLFVLAPAGLGKTSVLHIAVAEAQGRFDVRMGGGDAVEAALPYGLIGQVLGDEDDRAVPGMAGDLPAANRFYDALRRIRRAAAAQPLLLALDDLHWADPDSLTFLHLLCRRAPTLPLAIVATARPWPDPALRAAEQLAAHGLAAIQWLPPLTDPAARDLLQDRVGDLGEAADRVVAACDGNPLLLELALPGADAAGHDVAGGRPGAEATRRLLLARFSATDPIAQRYLRAASVLGTRFRPSAAAAVADLPAGQAAGTVEALFSADLFRGDDAGWVRFRHSLIRQAIYDDLAPPARAYLHERALRALLVAGVPIGEAAEHAIAAGLFGDAQAIEALTAAGRAALHAGAVQAARRYLDAAIELSGESAPAALQIDLARALLAGGAAEAAAALLDRILTRRPGLPAPARLSAQLLLGQAAFHSGAVQRAGELFDTVSAAPGGADRGLVLNALLDHTLQRWARLGPRAALPVAARARALAAGASSYQQACAEAAWALCAWLTGDPAGLAAAETAAQTPAPVASPADAAHWGLDPAAVPADIAVWAEQFPLAERLLTRALRIAEERAEPFLLFHAALSSSDMLCRLGRLGDALDMADRACDVAELLPVGLPLARAAKGLVLLETGHLAEAAAYADPAAGEEWYLATGYQLRLRATLAYRQGRIDAACTAFESLEQHTSQRGITDPSHIPYAADAIAAYLAADRPRDASRVAGQLAACPLPSRWPAATATAGRAAVAAHAGDLETAESSLAQATRMVQAMPMPLAQSRTLTAYGAVLARRGQRDKARQILTSALQQAQACGAGWHAHQALTELRRAGGRAPRIPPGQLSPQEKAVARLARAGRTNRQISQELYLSVNTVETHLANAYRKLGIGRRSELSGQELD